MCLQPYARLSSLCSSPSFSHTNLTLPLPIPKFCKTIFNDVLFLPSVADSVLENNGKVLVHCHAGISRSATICIAYLMFKNNVSLEKAFDHVRSRRGVTSPNLNFMQQLQEFEKDILGARSFELPDTVSDLSSSLASVEFDFSVSSSSSDYSTQSGSSETFDFSFAPLNIPQSPRTPLMTSS